MPAGWISVAAFNIRFVAAAEDRRIIAAVKFAIAHAGSPGARSALTDFTQAGADRFAYPELR